jgi:hypothetical protein
MSINEDNNQGSNNPILSQQQQLIPPGHQGMSSGINPSGQHPPPGVVGPMQPNIGQHPHQQMMHQQQHHYPQQSMHMNQPPQGIPQQQQTQPHPGQQAYPPDNINMLQRVNLFNLYVDDVVIYNFLVPITGYKQYGRKDWFS